MDFQIRYISISYPIRDSDCAIRILIATYFDLARGDFERGAAITPLAFAMHGSGAQEATAVLKYLEAIGPESNDPKSWMPAFAGMTHRGSLEMSHYRAAGLDTAAGYAGIRKINSVKCDL